MKQFLHFSLALLVTTSLCYATGWWLWAPATDINPLLLMSKKQGKVHSTEEMELMTRRVDALWTRIENKLKQVVPQEYACLAPGCEPEKLKDLEVRLGFELPIEVRASLLRHDGSNREIGWHFGGMCDLLSIEKIRVQCAESVELLCAPSYGEWSKDSGAIINFVPIAESYPFTFKVNCDDGRIVIGQNGSRPFDFFAFNWTYVLERWADALEKEAYVWSKDRTYFNVENWGGLNPY